MLLAKADKLVDYYETIKQKLITSDHFSLSKGIKFDLSKKIYILVNLLTRYVELKSKTSSYSPLYYPSCTHFFS